jgi:hypothetical protein
MSDDRRRLGVVTVEEIATTEKNSASYVARVLRLTLRCWCGRLLWVGENRLPSVFFSALFRRKPRGTPVDGSLFFQVAWFPAR